VSRRRLRLIALTLAALALLGLGGQSVARLWQMTRQVAALEREIAALRAEAERLAAQVEQLRTDPEAVERVAREELGLVKPGERVLKLPPSPR
jgi:cell division protein FtsB